MRSWREILRTRQALVQIRSACHNRIHALLAKEGLVVPVSDLSGRRGRRWLAAQSLSLPHHQLVEVLAGQADTLTLGIKALEEGLRQALGEHPVVSRLITVPGFGFLTAATFLAKVGDVARFPYAFCHSWASETGFRCRLETLWKLDASLHVAAQIVP